jgi:hypothetical protein
VRQVSIRANVTAAAELGTARVYIDDDAALRSLERRWRLAKATPELRQEAPDPATAWVALASPLAPQEEMAVAVEVIRACKDGMQSAQERLQRVSQLPEAACEAREAPEGIRGFSSAAWVGGEGEGEGEAPLDPARVRLVLTLLYGELLAYRAVAEYFIGAVEERGEQEEAEG